MSAIFEAVGDPGGGRWLIRVIKGGLSLNGRFFAGAALREAAPLFEGARVFEKSDEEHLKGAGKSVRNLIGGLTAPRYVAPTPSTPEGELVAELKLIDPEGPAAKTLRKAHERGLSGLFGFSIDARGVGKSVLVEGRRVHRVEKFLSVNSVDMIVEPGAGGELLELVEAAPGGEDVAKEQGTMELREAMIDAVRTKRPDYVVDGVSDDQLMQDYAEAMRETAPAEGLAAAKETAERVIGRAKLPEPAKQRLKERFAKAGAAFTEKDVREAVDDERAYLARMTESGKPNMGFGAIEVADRVEKVADMLDAFFDPAHKHHGAVRSIRECYVEATGDRDVTGDVRRCNLSRMRESLGIREAVVSTGWANALGDAVTRRMLAIYRGETDLQAWRKVARVVPVNDFRTQERLRVGGYGNLPGVAEAAPYLALTTPDDEVATYAVTKRGGTERVTIEAIANDDVDAVRQVPVELGMAGAHTLHEFVFDFFRTNPAIYTGNAFFHAEHGNLFGIALSETNFAVHRLAMGTQARPGSAKRMGLKPRTLLVAMELEETAYNLFVRDTNLDPSFVQAMKPEVVVVPYWTDANDWCTVADPAKLPALEIGFLNGNEEPELFVQDQPNAGSLFTNDVITYKIRHIYGGTVPVDGEKAATKSILG